MSNKKKEDQSRRLSTYYAASLRSLAENKAAAKKSLQDADKSKLVSILNEVENDVDLVDNEITAKTPDTLERCNVNEVFDSSKAAGVKKFRDASNVKLLAHALTKSNKKLNFQKKTPTKNYSFAEKISDPAYLKFAENLRYQKDDHNDFVKLPAKYRDVYSFFVEVDKILFLHYNRKEACVFSDLAKNVNKTISDSKVTHKQLNSAVFSKMYKLRPDFFRLYVNHAPSGLLRLAHDFADSLVMLEPDYKTTLEAVGKRRVAASHLIWRKQQIHEKLIQRVLHCHNLFLHKRYQLKIKPDKVHLIKRLHPKFQLEMVDALSNDEDNADIYERIDNRSVQSSDSEQTVKRAIAARQVLINNDLKINKELNRIIADDTSSGEQSSNNISTSSPMLSKVNASFLERIKLKESRQKATETILNSLKDEKLSEKRMNEKLPDLLKLIGCYFAAEKKTSYHCDSLVDKIVRNEKQGLFEGFERFEILKMFTLLEKNLPDMISLKKLDSFLFLKLSLIRLSVEEGVSLLKKKVCLGE